MVNAPTQTNAADECTKSPADCDALWNGGTVSAWDPDSGDEAETSKREALAEPGRWARVEALNAIPRSVLIATLMQRTFVTRIHGWNGWNWLSTGLNELRGQPWLTVDKCSVASEWNRPTLHLRCDPTGRVDVVYAQTTCRFLVDILLCVIS